jgi:predicted transcriptional regulator
LTINEQLDCEESEMITVDLDHDRQQRIAKLAETRGQSVSRFAQGVLEHYIDFQTWPLDSEEDWAVASENLVREVLPAEDWSEEAGDGSR